MPSLMTWPMKASPTPARRIASRSAVIPFALTLLLSQYQYM